MSTVITQGAPRPAVAGVALPRRPQAAPALLLAPAVFVLIAFFVFPLARIVWRSLSDPQLGFGNYTALLSDGVTGTVLLRTAVVAVVVTVATLLLAYPYAYAMTIVTPTTRAVMVTLVLLPFWTSVMARNFAWLLLMQDRGPIQRLFALFGQERVVLLGTVAGVTVAMTQVLLPYMVLPLYSSMQQIDRRLLQAGQSLGATRPTTFRTVYLPLSSPGIAAGGSLVFILSLGFYITPALLGSPQKSLVAQLLATRTTQLLDFAGAGALGAVVLAVTLVLVLVVSRVAKPASALADATGQP